MLGGFGFGQSFAVQAAGEARTVSLLATSVAQDAGATATPTRLWQQARGAPEHILVTLDGSEFAEQALPAAESICLAFNARLTLVSVLPERKWLWPIGRSSSQTGEQGKGRRETDAYLREVAKRMRAKGIDVDHTILHGPVAESVNQLMQEQAIDMSIICTHGRSGLQRLVLGSVADDLVKLVDRPVLIIHPAPEGPPPVPGFGKLLVALDGSQFAERVLPMVRASTKYESVVLLLRVPEAPEPERFGTMVEEIEKLRAEAETEASQYLEGIAAALRAEGIETQVLVTGSRPAEAITQVAEGEDVDVIMLSTHGQGGMEGALVGSVADRVVQQTYRPVLLVPIHERRLAASEE
jgi:nucleotide-binding universal stress UspA family protein